MTCRGHSETPLLDSYIAVIGVGVAVLRGGDTLGGAAVVGVGIAVIGDGGNTLVKAGTIGRIRDHLTALLRDPDDPDQTDTG